MDNCRYKLTSLSQISLRFWLSVPAAAASVGFNHKRIRTNMYLCKDNIWPEAITALLLLAFYSWHQKRCVLLCLLVSNLRLPPSPGGPCTHWHVPRVSTGNNASPLFMGRGHLKARLTDQKMLLIGGAALVGVINAPCLTGIALASRWKFGDSAEFSVFPAGSDCCSVHLTVYFSNHMLKNTSTHGRTDYWSASVGKIARMQPFPGSNNTLYWSKSTLPYSKMDHNSSLIIFRWHACLRS